MKVHHLNCTSMHPPFARLINGEGGFFSRGLMPCHCLLIESDQGLVLVDTGFGLLDCAEPSKRVGASATALLGLRYDPEETAARQVERLGFRRDDVRHIVLTHLDLDHAGGLADFPKAKIHVDAREHAAAETRVTLSEMNRYRPIQWAHGPDWALHAEGGESWMGFSAMRPLAADDERPLVDILMLPLPGHTRGHCGVAIRGDDRWIMHCGDAYFHRGSVRDSEPRAPKGLLLYQRAVDQDHAARVQNQSRIHALAAEKADAISIFCAHDFVEYERCLRA